MGWQPETQPKGKPPAEKTKGKETMKQRLIDANALTDKVDKYIYRITRASKRKLKVGELAILADIKAHIELMPTVEAIPVEWILNNERMPEGGTGRKAIMDMIEDWKKEHEETD